jgi:hypothetical protein
MSKVTLSVLFAAIGLVVSATYFEVPGFSGGVGVLIVAGLVYAFHVAQREVLLLTHSMEVRENERREKSARSPAMPREMRSVSGRSL